MAFVCDQNTEGEFFVAQKGSKSGNTKVVLAETKSNHISSLKQIEIIGDRDVVLDHLDTFGQFPLVMDFDEKGNNTRVLRYKGDTALPPHIGHGTLSSYDSNLATLQKCCSTEPCRGQHMAKPPKKAFPPQGLKFSLPPTDITN